MTELRMNAPEGWRELPDDKLAWLVIEVIWEWADFYGEYPPFVEQMDELTTGQRAVYATTWLDREVKNGGFYQFFENSTGMLGPEALAGFRVIGMGESADCVKAAFRYFGMKPYPRDTDERTDRLPDYESTEEECDELDDAYYESTYDKTSGEDHDSILERMQAAYIRTHPDEFFV
ncbi:MAG: DMP19 family protein [Planctomycetes bacterium]|nr:DMP19 family protein [Planctomycetota bacterium]MCA8937048.1 DMP19 family protein [Planctomycetota bacterium]